MNNIPKLFTFLSRVEIAPSSLYTHFFVYTDVINEMIIRGIAPKFVCNSDHHDIVFAEWFTPKVFKIKLYSLI